MTRVKAARENTLLRRRHPAGLGCVTGARVLELRCRAHCGLWQKSRSNSSHCPVAGILDAAGSHGFPTAACERFPWSAITKLSSIEDHDYWLDLASMIALLRFTLSLRTTMHYYTLLGGGFCGASAKFNY
eukprot:COSAG01_NODE_150_length_23941_cov_44.277200_8_plen_130_part_00